MWLARVCFSHWHCDTGDIHIEGTQYERRLIAADNARISDIW